MVNDNSPKNLQELSPTRPPEHPGPSSLPSFPSSSTMSTLAGGEGAARSGTGLTQRSNEASHRHPNVAEQDPSSSTTTTSEEPSSSSLLSIWIQGRRKAVLSARLRQNGANLWAARTTLASAPCMCTVKVPRAYSLVQSNDTGNDLHARQDSRQEKGSSVGETEAERGQRVSTFDKSSPSSTLSPPPISSRSAEPSQISAKPSSVDAGDSSSPPPLAYDVEDTILPASSSIASSPSSTHTRRFSEGG